MAESDVAAAAKVQSSVGLTGATDGLKKDPDAISALYDDWGSKKYDDDVTSWGYKAPESAIQYLREAAGADVLKGSDLFDAGAGTGLLAEHLKDAGVASAVAGDISPELLTLAEKRNFYKLCKKVDLTKTLEFDTDQFSVTMCVGTLTYMDPSDGTLEELVRVTKPGGYVLYSMRTDHEAKWVENREQMSKSGLWKHVGDSGPLPYLPQNPDYADNVLVTMCVFQVC